MEKISQSIIFKCIFGILLLLIVFSGIIGAIGYNAVTDSLLSEYSAGAFQTARIAQEKLDGDRMDAYIESEGKTEEYRKAFDELDQLCNESGSMFVYVIQPDLTDYAHIKFWFSTINRDSEFTQYEFGYLRETTNDDYKNKYRALYENEAEQALVVRNIGYIETDPHITAMVPLENSKGETVAIICVQRQMDVLEAARGNFVRKMGLALVILTVLILVIQGIMLYVLLFRPLRTIKDETSRFARENVAAEQKLKEVVKSNDEIGDLAESIDTMEERITEYVEDLRVVTAENERIGTELSLAKSIQASMLPSIFPAFPDDEEIDVFASMTPAKEVGGDFYDFFKIDDDHLCIAIADVSGKGVPAALYMMASTILLRTNARLGIGPAGILENMNEALCTNNRDEMFVTVWVGILDLDTGVLTAANAGHEYPAVTGEDGKFGLLKDKHGFVIGGFEGMKYTEYELRMEPGAKIFVYTDGVPEATDAEENMYGTDRMVEALNEAHGEPPEKILEEVERSVRGFVGDAEQFDDLTMLCLEYRGRN